MSSRRTLTGGKRKLRLDRRYSFDHHRCGWQWVEDGIADALVSESAPTRFVGALECELGRSGKPIAGPWIGISHHAAEAPQILESAYSPVRVSLNRFRDLLMAGLGGCLGIYCLSEYMRRHLRDMLDGSDVPVERLLHPTPLDVPQFSWDRFQRLRRPKIIQLGHWFRRFHVIYDLPVTRYEKVWLPGRRLETKALQLLIANRGAKNGEVSTPGRVDNDEYDALLSENIAVLPLYDASASNSLLECIARATPVLVDPLPAIQEYLGADYPLYFHTLEDAARKCEDDGALLAAHEYLLQLPKRQFTRDNFLRRLEASKIYQDLP